MLDSVLSFGRVRSDFEVMCSGIYIDVDTVDSGLFGSGGLLRYLHLSPLCRSY